MKKFIITLSAIALTGFTHIASANTELCRVENNDCTFVLLSEKTSQTMTEKITEGEKSSSDDKVTQASSTVEKSETLLLINQQRAKQAFSPFSTFKVPNSLIGLDTQLIKDAKQTLTYDKEKFKVQKWWPSVWRLPEYNLSSAFKFSMVAIYRQLAMDIGQERMQSYVTKFAYGNQDISSGLDDFWLNGSLQISALEQVYFLQKMAQGKLAVSPESVNVLKEVMLVESTDTYKIYAKTGAGRAYSNDKSSKAMLGWYVGFVENTQGTHYFAFNFTRESYAKMKGARVQIAMNHLKAAGVI